MAIDSEDKRRSIHAYSSGDVVLPIADSTVDAADRKHAAGVYRGSLTIPPPGDMLALLLGPNLGNDLFNGTFQ